MSLDAQIIIGQHVTIDEIVNALTTIVHPSYLAVRPMQKEEYKVIEFIDSNGEGKSIDVFLNSYAADDYSEVCDGQTTFLSMKAGSLSSEQLSLFVKQSGGYVRNLSSEDWQKISPASM